jgi:hypothetical protein
MEASSIKIHSFNNQSTMKQYPKMNPTFSTKIILCICRRRQQFSWGWWWWPFKKRGWNSNRTWIRWSWMTFNKLRMTRLWSIKWISRRWTITWTPRWWTSKWTMSYQTLGCPLGGRYPWTLSYPLIIHTTDWRIRNFHERMEFQYNKDDTLIIPTLVIKTENLRRKVLCLTNVTNQIIECWIIPRYLQHKPCSRTRWIL